MLQGVFVGGLRNVNVGENGGMLALRLVAATVDLAKFGADCATRNELSFE
jgi:hypothetical protein